MSKPMRKYGKTVRKSRAEQLWAELPKSPVITKTQPEPKLKAKSEPETELELKLELKAEPMSEPESEQNAELEQQKFETTADKIANITNKLSSVTITSDTPLSKPKTKPSPFTTPKTPALQLDPSDPEDLRILTWDDVCPFGDRIEKIAEASYAEVYRITNDRGISIIKVIRLKSPIKPQTKPQERSGLVDEEPHSEDDLLGELKISEWLADIPGFVVYKERYIVKGKAPKVLLETHQAFHRRMKRKDPDRLQFYPSPSRYLDETQFLVVELGDAGTALEDFQLTSAAQLWDIFLHTAIALARAEDLVKFEHRDLHEGNLCIRKVKPAVPKTGDDPCQFGYSGLDITILDYGLSRAEDPESDGMETVPVFYDLEKDLSIFTSTHAPQCKVYREMRSFLLQDDRLHLLPNEHDTPYAPGVDGKPISWASHLVIHIIKQTHQILL